MFISVLVSVVGQERSVLGYFLLVEWTTVGSKPSGVINIAFPFDFLKRSTSNLWLTRFGQQSYSNNHHCLERQIKFPPSSIELSVFRDILIVNLTLMKTNGAVLAQFVRDCRCQSVSQLQKSRSYFLLPLRDD